MPPSFHVSLTDDLLAKMKPFAATRGISMSEVIRTSLEALFSFEDLDSNKALILKNAVNYKFSVPPAIPIKAFYIFLYLLANKYPNGSSKDFWSVVYQSSIDKTHAEIYAEIKDDVDRRLRGGVTNGRDT